MTEIVKIFTYGSCHLSEQLDSDEIIGNGGYGIVINVNGKKIKEISGGLSNTTNSRIELIAVIEALQQIDKSSDITVYLSNENIVNAVNKRWFYKWIKKGKKKRNIDLWAKLKEVLPERYQSISFVNSRNVKLNPDFQLAERLAKSMSGKRNLPIDIKKQIPVEGDLFGDNDSLNEDPTEELEITDDTPILDSVCVDASCIQNPGPTEYRGVDTRTKKVIFENKFEEATNNIGEFLAIVHALALYKKEGKELKIVYSDSAVAITWVRKKRCKTKFERTRATEKVFDAIERAISWLENNQYSTKVLKWNTGAWGEIAADYGRKPAPLQGINIFIKFP